MESQNGHCSTHRTGRFKIMDNENTPTTTSANQPTQPPAPKKVGTVISRTLDTHGDNGTVRAEITIVAEDGKSSMTRHLRVISSRPDMATTADDAEAFKFDGDAVREIEVPGYVGSYVKPTKKVRVFVQRKRSKRVQAANEDGGKGKNGGNKNDRPGKGRNKNPEKQGGDKGKKGRK